MKKQLLLFILMLICISSIGQNVNDKISVVTWSYTMTGSYDEVKLSVGNYSDCNIKLFNVYAIDASSYEIFFSEINSGTSLNSNDSKSYQFTRSNYGSLSQRGWYLNIVYLNLNDGKLYHKAVIKKANSYGSNVSLADATPLPNNNCINNNISVFLGSISSEYVGGVIQENLELSLNNNSSKDMKVQTVFAYDTSINNIFSSDIAPNLSISANNSAKAKVNYNGGNYLMLGTYYISIIYTCNNQVFMKTVLKTANTYDTTVALEDASQEYTNGIETKTAEEIIIDNYCYDLDFTTKEATFRNNPQNGYSGDIVIPMFVSYEGEEFKVTKIKSSTFSNNWNVTSVSIPETVKTIESSAFYVCLNMTQLQIADGLETIGDNAFYNCNGLSMVTIPNTVKTIGREAFYACYGLKTVVLGSGVSKIGYHAFQNCNKLLDFYCYAYNVPDATLSFDSSIKNATLHVPFSSLSSYKFDFDWNDFKSIIAISENDPKPTRINVVENTQNKNATVYDLNGVRLSEPKKGINIINGQKVAIK